MHSESSSKVTTSWKLSPPRPLSQNVHSFSCNPLCFAERLLQLFSPRWLSMRVRNSRVEVNTQVHCPGSPLLSHVFSGKLPNLSPLHIVLAYLQNGDDGAPKDCCETNYLLLSKHSSILIARYPYLHHTYNACIHTYTHIYMYISIHREMRFQIPSTHTCRCM